MDDPESAAALPPTAVLQESMALLRVRASTIITATTVRRTTTATTVRQRPTVVATEAAITAEASVEVVAVAVHQAAVADVTKRL